MFFNAYSLQVKFVPLFNSFFHDDYKSVNLVTPTSDITVEIKFKKKKTYYAIEIDVEDMIRTTLPSIPHRGSGLIYRSTLYDIS